MTQVNNSTRILTQPRRECESYGAPLWGIATSLALVLLSFGCASSNVNPVAAKPNTGYVDFYAQPDDDLCWQVEQFDSDKNRFRPVYSDVKYLEGPILRLAFKAGSHRLRVTFLNRVVSAPGECVVTVLDGRITPVQVTLLQTGTSLVLSPRTSRGGTAYRRYARRAEIESSEAVAVTVSLSTLEPQAYQLKEQTPHARSTGTNDHQ